MAKLNIATTAGAILLAVPLLVAGPAHARQNAQTQNDAAIATSSGVQAEKKICKRLETSGTRMAKRACHTAEEWKKIDDMR